MYVNDAVFMPVEWFWNCDEGMVQTVYWYVCGRALGVDGVVWTMYLVGWFGLSICSVPR